MKIDDAIKAMKINSESVVNTVNRINDRLDRAQEADRHRHERMISDISSISTRLTGHDREFKKLNERLDDLQKKQRSQEDETQSIKTQLVSVEKVAGSKFSVKSLEAWRKVIPYVIAGGLALFGLLESKLDLIFPASKPSQYQMHGDDSQPDPHTDK
jgi:septal ring factor EnvC (AmiA/AmiB activator)